MSDQACEQQQDCTPCNEAITKPTARTKRDIFRFTGEKPTAINLEHITHMALEGKRITFFFYSTSLYIDLDDEAAASSVFEILLKTWASEV